MVGIDADVLKQAAEAELFLHAGDATPKPKSHENEQKPAAQETVKTDEMRLNATGSSQKLWHQLHRKGLLRPIGGGRVVQRCPRGWGMLGKWLEEGEVVWGCRCRRHCSRCDMWR